MRHSCIPMMHQLQSLFLMFRFTPLVLYTLAYQNNNNSSSNDSNNCSKVARLIVVVQGCCQLESFVHTVLVESYLPCVLLLRPIYVCVCVSVSVCLSVSVCCCLSACLLSSRSREVQQNYVIVVYDVCKWICRGQ